jgi:hypothetical protein
MTRRLTYGLAMLIAATAAQSALACQGGGKVAFEDKFAKLDTGWSQDQNVTVTGGKLVAKAPDSNGDHILYQANVFPESDLCVTQSFAATPDPTNAVAGIIFWAVDDSHYYVLEISADGSWAVARKLTDTRWILPIKWGPNPQVKKGLNTANELEVLTKGPLATLFINGTKVGEVTGQPPDGGQLIGVFWQGVNGGETRVEYTNVKISN